MSNIKLLPGAVGISSAEPNLALIEQLGGLLDAARSGRLQSFIGTGFADGGNSRYAFWSDSHDDTYQMLGALAWLQAEYIQRHTT